MAGQAMHLASSEMDDVPRQRPGQRPDQNNLHDAALNYLEAMAGFMGIVDTPKEADPEAEAAAAVAFLENLWTEESNQVREADRAFSCTLAGCGLHWNDAFGRHAITCTAC
jgi:hypothetical protein